MLRVFLIIDDYNELVYLQTLLRKMGFDTEGLQNPKKFADLSLGFNPQVVITTARGNVVDGFALARGIRKRKGFPKIIALVNQGQDFSKEDPDEAGIDSFLDTPVNPKRLILAIASLASLDEAVLFEKFGKIQGAGSTAQSAADVTHNVVDHTAIQSNDYQRIKGDSILSEDVQQFVKDSNDTLEEFEKIENSEMRKKRFDKWRQEVGPLPQKSFDREKILSFNKMIRSLPPPEDIDEIEAERKTFVKSLFEKGLKK